MEIGIVSNVQTATTVDDIQVMNVYLETLKQMVEIAVKYTSNTRRLHNNENIYDEFVAEMFRFTQDTELLIAKNVSLSDNDKAKVLAKVYAAVNRLKIFVKIIQYKIDDERERNQKPSIADEAFYYFI